MKLTNSINNDKNFWDSKMTKDGDIEVNSIPLNKIKDVHKINVLFADCEGCLESFIDEYHSFLKQLRLIIYEADQTHICNYDKIKKILIENKFKKIVHEGQMLVWVKI